jgi:hypothetical protein
MARRLLGAAPKHPNGYLAAGSSWARRLFFPARRRGGGARKAATTAVPAGDVPARQATASAHLAARAGAPLADS